MKKIMFPLITTVCSLLCCTAPVKEQKAITLEKGTMDKMPYEDLNKELDSLTAEGEYCLVRGSDKEYDTIIDHVRYRYVKDLGQDTPIDSTKHIITE